MTVLNSRTPLFQDKFDSLKYTTEILKTSCVSSGLTLQKDRHLTSFGPADVKKRIQL